MDKYFIQVEAVNISNFVLDTYDISTIRGGSFILLESIKQLALKFEDRIQAIATDASIGIFSFEGDDDKLESLLSEIKEFLFHGTENDATFVVAYEKAPADKDEDGYFPAMMERLQAQIRRQQWRIPTVSIPEYRESKKECYLNGWRPGIIPYLVGDEDSDAYISAATSFKRERGRAIKHQLFYDLLDDEFYKDNLCARDLNALARLGKKRELNGKIAYIHIDGNDFGKIRKLICKTSEKRTKFDRTIQAFRNNFLRELLRLADQDADFKTKDDKGNEALRLEVLLWGGDEIILIVPAWKGWEVLRLFYKLSADLQYDELSLTHRAAMVFCHHNAPILKIRELAENLLHQTKLDIRQIASGGEERDGIVWLDHINGDSLHYLVLESFDMLKGSLERFLKQYYLEVLYPLLLINANDLEMTLENLKILKQNLSHSKILQIIKALQMNQENKVEEIITDSLSLVPIENRNEAQSAIECLMKKAPDRWYLLSDLRDYLEA